MTSDITRVVVRRPVAPLFAEPKVASAQISQYLAGRELCVLETRDDWDRVSGPDAYEGWLHHGYTAPVTGDVAHGQPSGLRISLGCTTTDAAGIRRLMPLGAWLAPDERIRSGEAIESSERPTIFPADAHAIPLTAQRYFEGTSYVWGGVTPWGADCSGLAQSVFALHGFQLKRDAWMQAEEGTPGDADPMNACAADLLFFSDRIDRRITHVAISMGQRRLVHLALGRGGYAVEHLDNSSDPYVEKLLARFITARRILPPVSR
jgi:gamma-D-glutamyl-L-lysine dipeptidyl-peptidase